MERPCVSDVPSDTKRFLKKLGFLGGCGLASAPNVFQKLWRKAFDVNRTQLGTSIKTISRNRLHVRSQPFRQQEQISAGLYLFRFRCFFILLDIKALQLFQQCSPLEVKQFSGSFFIASGNG